MSSHSHAHHHHAPATGRFLGLSVVLTMLFVLVEAGAGLWSHSLALLSDAGHNFADGLALAFTFYAVSIARRPPDARRTFGYHRVGILAAFANAFSLVVLALVIFWQGLMRLRFPQPVESLPMIGIALFAIFLNLLISLWLRREAQTDINVKAAYVHMLGDAASALGVVLAGIIVYYTGSPMADPIVSFLIAGLILWSSWGILAEATNVLLEAVPRHLDMPALEQSIRQTSGVQDVHDLHVWTVTSGLVACSCHILVTEQSVRAGQQVLKAVAETLRTKYQITHTTVQVEIEGCEPNDMYCSLKILHPPHSH